MVGITFSAEQIHQAPPEVRRWIEKQVSETLGLSRAAPVAEAPTRHLVGCDLEQARAVLSLINGVLPAVGVFFELAHEPIAVTPQGLHVLRLDEMQRHCRLQGPDQVVACLGAIDEALRRVSGAPDVALTALDGAGHCMVADVTAQSILGLWLEITGPSRAAHPVAQAAATPEEGLPRAFSNSIPVASAGGQQPTDAAA
jgi:hypothetical protein